MGEPVHRVADDVDVGDLGRDPRPDPVDELAARASSAPRRRRRDLQRDGGRERGGHAHAAGEPAVLVLGPVGERRTPGRVTRTPIPPGPPQSPASAASSVPGVADVDVAEARARVDEQRDAGRARRGVHGVDRLQRADLAVRVLQGGERHARAGATRGDERVGVDPAEPVDRDGDRGSPAKSAALSTAARSTAPTTTSGPVAPPPARDRPDRAVQRRRVRRREVDVLASARRRRRRSPRARRRAASARGGPRRAAGAGPPSPGRGPRRTRCAPPASSGARPPASRTTRAGSGVASQRGVARASARSWSRWRAHAGTVTPQSRDQAGDRTGSSVRRAARRVRSKDATM